MYPMEKPMNPLRPEDMEGDDIEVQLDPTVMTEDGGAIVDLGDDDETPIQTQHNDNLAEFMEEEELTELATDLIEAFDADQESRSDWEKAYIVGLDLLGLNFEDRTTPWDGACGVFHPMLAEAVVRFQAQTIQELFPATGPARVSIVGKQTTDKTKQAARVQEYMNFLSTKQMTEYRNETEKLLFSLPIAGSAFRKLYHDESYGRPVAGFVPAEDFVVSYSTTDLTTCERATHIMRRTPNQIRKKQVSGFYRDIELPEPEPDQSEIRRKYDKLTGSKEQDYQFDGRHTLLEMYVDYDLEGFEDPDGIALPYVVTIDKSSKEVLSIYRNWYEDDPKRIKRDHFVHYPYLPGLGFYGFGLVHMIGGLSKSATSLLRQLVDSGTLANLPGGLKSRGLRIKGDDTPIKPGEFRDVDIPSGAIRDNITFLPYKEPSGVLYQLLGDIVNEGRRFASAADVKVADMSGETPVGTTLAILEREMKVLSAIQARIHAAMGMEMRLLGKIIKDFGPENYPYEIEGEYTLKEDFDQRIDIIPVSDPSAGTMAQRIMQYQAALQLAAQAPQMYNLPLLHRQMLDVLGIQDAQNIVPTEDDLLPSDPVSETMALINGKPVRAYMYQDHEAHIESHMAAAQNPVLMKLMEKHPNVKAVAAAGAAHLAEHLAFAYRRKIEEELGVALPSPEEPLPEDIELRLSRLVAPASKQLTGKAQQQAQAEENAKKQEDPIVQMAQKELEIKEQTAKAKAKTEMEKIHADLKKANDRLELDKQRLAQEGRIAGGKLVLESAKQKSSDEATGFKIGLDMVKGAMDGRSDRTKD